MKQKKKIAWLDANVILRFLLADHESMFMAAHEIFQNAAAGRINLFVHPVTVAEIVWTLDSFYGYGRNEIAETLRGFFMIDGLVLKDKDVVLAALVHYRDKNVDYIDAYLAAVAAANPGHAVVTLDRKHFSRLHHDLIIPGK